MANILGVHQLELEMLHLPPSTTLDASSGLDGWWPRDLVAEGFEYMFRFAFLILGRARV